MRLLVRFISIRLDLFFDENTISLSVGLLFYAVYLFFFLLIIVDSGSPVTWRQDSYDDVYYVY